ncbi:DUF2971 domain-containing protein [Cereibacter sphaeroides]|uniref:DUF2971 domain-containing protein n=1 Tax=Cereibacter sphaeroides TaxID=1063 RepID=UPI000A96BE8C|nr:DUF2971 domain-containing protein [Cereibacter sphaeroides]QJC86115.1 DUF2971 domain-containing protein [Cereibacter sphaeroides]
MTLSVTNDDEQDRIEQIFFHHARSRSADLRARGARFAHYTSAYAALQIIEKEEVWMRNAVVMNDFSEIQHGQDCVNHALQDPVIGGVAGGRLHTILEDVKAGLSATLLEDLMNIAVHQTIGSYLVSISEHGNGSTEEDQYGRLSMWRAYGGNTNVAFVFRTTPFFARSTAYTAFTSPVHYCCPTSFKGEFESFVSRLERERAFLCSLGGEEVRMYVTNALHFAILSLKHPGFREEREWRVIHSPSLMPSPRIRYDIETINGVPQRVYKLPLMNFPEEGLIGATLPELIEEIIIGPTATPWPIYEALASKLEAKGMQDAWRRVRISNIPLRR